MEWENDEYENTERDGDESEAEITGPELAHAHMKNGGARRMRGVAGARVPGNRGVHGLRRIIAVKERLS